MIFCGLGLERPVYHVLLVVVRMLRSDWLPLTSLAIFRSARKTESHGSKGRHKDVMKVEKYFKLQWYKFIGT